MVSQAKGNVTGKRPQKLFGLMSKRRWFGVCMFLVALMWSYTVGPDLEYAHISNRYSRDVTSYDLTTVAKEGDGAVFTQLFEPNYFKQSFVWQSATNFQEATCPIADGNHILFVDEMLYSLSEKGVMIEMEELGDQVVSIAVDPKRPENLFFVESAQKRVMKLNRKTGKKTVVVDKDLGAPQSLTIDSRGRELYVTDASGKVVRVDIAKRKIMETGDAKLKNPKGLALSTDGEKLFVTECVDGQFAVSVFDTMSRRSLKRTRRLDHKTLHWDESGKSQLMGASGCSSGVAQHPSGYLFVTCPGDKVCIVNSETGEMRAAIKLADGASPNDVTIAQDRLYITTGKALWEVRLKAELL